MKTSIASILLTAVSVISLIAGGAEPAAACDVLVVSSYQETFFRTIEINTGIEEVLAAECTLTYHYLDALTEPAGIEAKAAEAYQLYQTLQPDGVIAVGEEAQTAFVKPHLENQVDTPVMFNNIFFPEVYEYPSENVSGIRLHWPAQEAIIFTQQLVPTVQTVGFLFADEPSGRAVMEQVNRERQDYPVEAIEPVMVNTAQDVVQQAEALKDQCDALYIGPMSTLLATADDTLNTHHLLMTAITTAFGKPPLTNLQQYVEAGLLCGVKDFGQEQGQVSAEMLQQAMVGTPVSDLPIRQNQYGQRILNKTTLKAFEITPSRRVLTGTEIVETTE